MSNFQRTRSKVWWGDSPPSVNNINSPVAQNWNPNPPHNVGDDWEPQLPHWIANQPIPPENQENVAPNAVVLNQWPQRHGSPGSHKSQDSGFSDSDSSPPPSQYYSSPENADSKLCKSSSSDSNNNENITVKQANDFKDSPEASTSVKKENPEDEINNNETNTPKTRFRSISVIQTPCDLQQYYEVHHDEEHMELLKDNNENDGPNKSAESSTPPKKINNADANKEQYSTLPEKTTSTKSFISAQEKESKTSRGIKVAKVKDLETGRQKSNESLEYIQLSDSQIAVNNQPRMRSPISSFTYKESSLISKTPIHKEFKRSVSNEDTVDGTIDMPKFQRTRLNKSLNYEAQRLDQQILDIQDGYHSLGSIDEDEQQSGTQQRNLTARHIVDSLNLKVLKKAGPKAKQRYAKSEKVKAQSCSFRIFPTKREKPSVVESHAGGILEGSRVPELGLPRFEEQNQWVVVGYPEQEKLISNYKERLVATPSDVNLSKLNEDKNASKRISPPDQFRDVKTIEKTPQQLKHKDSVTTPNSQSKLTHDTKREKLKQKDGNQNFVEQLNLASASTPKMLAPQEYMASKATPRSSIMNTQVRRLSLMNNVDVPQRNPLYRERSIDQTCLERLCERKPEPVQYWLCDLIGSSESECMTTLQSKSITAEVKAQVTASSATITGNIKKVQTHGQIIVHQYSDVLRQIEEKAPTEDQICLLVANVNEFVLAHSITLNTKPPGETPERWDKIKKSLQIYLQKLIDIGEDIKVELNESNAEWGVVKKYLESLINIFLETTRAVLVQQLRTLVSIIEEPPTDMILKSTLTSIGHLAMLTTDPESCLHDKCVKIMKTISELPFVECAVPRALLTVIIETNKSSIKALSLRALATVCVTGDAVRQFDEGGGIEIISDILSDKSCPEPQVREAITVLTQATAPWLHGHYDLRQLREYLDVILRNITEILIKTTCCQLVLLCTACIANLVRVLELQEKKPDVPQDDRCDVVEVLTKYRTIEKLLEAVKNRGPNLSVFLQEQTASLISTLSQAPRLLRLLSSITAVPVALVCFARVSVPSTALTRRHAEVRAEARLLCHTTEALSRLSIIPEVSCQLVELEAIPNLTRLVRLQRTKPARTEVNQDQILVHCLQTLRNIHKYSPESFEHYQKDADEMIKPHLLESLMLFSTKQESYV